MDVSGSCLCGKVTINLTGVAKEITVCHCSLCQKFHGGPMFALAPCSADQMALQGVKWLRRYDSSEWAQRGFCSQCGSSLFFYLKEAHTYFFAAGLFGNMPEAVLSEEIYTKDQPHFYHFAEPTTRWQKLQNP